MISLLDPIQIGKRFCRDKDVWTLKGLYGPVA